MTDKPETVPAVTEILYGTIAHNGGMYAVQFAYKRHPDGGGSGCSLSGCGPNVFTHALRDATLHPEAVVVDYRSAPFAAVATHAIRGPMSDDGQDAVPRGHVARFSVTHPTLVEPIGDKPPGPLDSVNWQDRADDAARIGATVTPFAQWIVEHARRGAA